MKRITTGGTDAIVTDDLLADLLLEYAKELGRLGQTDSITVPAVLHGIVAEASMLLGPATQMVVISLPDASGAHLPLPELEAVREDLRRRIDRVLGRGPDAAPTPDGVDLFIDFDEFDLGGA